MKDIERSLLALSPGGESRNNVIGMLGGEACHAEECASSRSNARVGMKKRDNWRVDPVKVGMAAGHFLQEIIQVGSCKGEFVQSKKEQNKSSVDSDNRSKIYEISCEFASDIVPSIKSYRINIG